MYQDENLINCPECNSLGIFAPNLFGKTEFFHKITSPRHEGYYTFTEKHFDECARCGEFVNPENHPAIGCDN